jgi:hypothetical protein
MRQSDLVVRGCLVAEDGRPIVEPGWGVYVPGPGADPFARPLNT